MFDFHVLKYIKTERQLDNQQPKPFDFLNEHRNEKHGGRMEDKKLLCYIIISFDENEIFALLKEEMTESCFLYLKISNQGVACSKRVERRTISS